MKTFSWFFDVLKTVLTFRWIIGAVAAVFLVTAATLKNYAVYNGGLVVMQWIIDAVLLSIALYPVAVKLFGLSVVKDGWKLKASIDKESEASRVAEFFGQLAQGICVGFKNLTEFREGLKDNDTLATKKELLAALSAFALCYSFGLLNLLFPIAFYFVILKHFEIDFAASVHLASSEIILGFMITATALLFHPGAWIFAIYPVASLIWLGLYARDKQMSYSLVMLQTGKIAIYLASKYIPFFVLSSFTIPI